MNVKHLLFSLALIILISASLLAQDHQDWKYMQPNPQANPVNKIQIIDVNTWIGVGGEGLYMKTTNAGVNWYFHNSAGLPNAAGTIGPNGDLYFTDALNGYITGSSGYIAKTTDGGVTFNTLADSLVPVNQNGKTMAFVDQYVAYVAFGSGDGEHGTVVKTTDGGLTWSIVYSNNSWSVTALCVPDKQTVYVVTMDGSVSKSTDGGQSWNTMNTVVPQDMMCTTFLDVNNILISGSGGTCSRTTDGGETWTAIQTPNSEWAYYQLKQVSPTEIYAVGDPGNLWKTSDFGTTWTAVPLNITWGTFDYLDWYSLDVRGSLFVISGFLGDILISTDNGLTWGSHQLSYNSNIIFDIKKAPGSNVVIAGGREWNPGLRQIFRSTNGGTTFTPIDLGVDFDVYAVSMVSDKVGYICGTNSIVMKTSDAGQTWSQEASPVSGPYISLYSMKFVNESTGWVFLNYSASDTNIFKTTNGGTSWIPQVTNGNAYGIMKGDMADEDNGYVTMNASGQPLYKTNDGGTTWTPIPIPLKGQVGALKVIDKNTLYLGSSYGTNRVAKSLDGGATWTTYALPAVVDINTMDFKDVNTGWVCGNLTTAACRTTDGGNTWSLQNYHLPTGAKIYITPGDTAFALGTWGTIMRNVTYAVPTGITVSSDNVPHGFTLEQNYPNPFNPSTSIKYSIPLDGLVNLAVYNVLGEKVLTLVNNDMKAGSYEIKFDASHYASGIYFYRLDTGTYSSVKKMILMK
ncbi:MAG: YCF48-related protein [Ignavibacteriaceae bacterium]|nr:YCF48-related protein [Ignavibacteriaceae bacterium]